AGPRRPPSRAAVAGRAGLRAGPAAHRRPAAVAAAPPVRAGVGPAAEERTAAGRAGVAHASPAGATGPPPGAGARRLSGGVYSQYSSGSLPSMARMLARAQSVQR